MEQDIEKKEAVDEITENSDLDNEKNSEPKNNADDSPMTNAYTKEQMLASADDKKTNHSKWLLVYRIVVAVIVVVMAVMVFMAMR